MFNEKVRSVLEGLVTVDWSSPVYIVHKCRVFDVVGTCKKCNGKKEVTVEGIKYVCKVCGGSGVRRDWTYKYLVTKSPKTILNLFANENHVEFGSCNDVFCITNSKKEAEALAKYLTKQESK